MDKQTIIDRLFELPGEIAAKEEDVLQAQARLVDAKDMLQQKEDDLLLGNLIDGKNAEIRAAQVRKFTVHEREILGDTEMALKNAAAHLEQARNEFRALRAIVDLLKEAA